MSPSTEIDLTGAHPLASDPKKIAVIIIEAIKKHLPSHLATARKYFENS